MSINMDVFKLVFSLSLVITISGQGNIGHEAQHYGDVHSFCELLVNTLQRTQETCATSLQGGSAEDIRVLKQELVNLQEDIRLLRQERHTTLALQGGSAEDIRVLKLELVNLQADVLLLRQERLVLQGGSAEEIRVLKQELVNVQDDILLQDLVIESEREKQQQLNTILSSSVTSLNTTVTSQGRQTELEKDEIWESLGSLNQTINNHNHDEQIQQLKTEISRVEQVINSNPFKCSQEGKLQVNYDCTISVCLQGYFRPYQGTRAADVSFEDLLAKGCIHIDRTRRTWDDGRTNCKAVGGDLFVPGDLAGANQYYSRQGLAWNGWVGVRAGAWIDGRTVAQEEWRSRQPSGGAEECGYIDDASYRGVWDYTCTYTTFSLCQKGVQYN